VVSSLSASNRPSHRRLARKILPSIGAKFGIVGQECSTIFVNPEEEEEEEDVGCQGK
jgi:hypothetical protein